MAESRDLINVKMNEWSFLHFKNGFLKKKRFLLLLLRDKHTINFEVTDRTYNLY